MKSLQRSIAAALLFAAPLSYAQLEGSKSGTTPTNHPVPAIQDTETPAQRDARMAWWREARLGMFIHWGLYSETAGTWNGQQIPGLSEWMMNNASIPVADYKALASQFNPTGFSAHDIVALAKSAGMKYIVITAKHHDGFAMYDSKVDPFNIVDATPFKRDPLRELAEECRKQGMKLGFYYSQAQDWTAPGGGAVVKGDHNKETGHWDPAQDGSFDDYIHKKVIPQLEELLNNYKDYPVVIWFDSAVAMKDRPQSSAEIVKLLNKYPNLIWNDRLGGGYKGDTESAEQFIPAQGFPGRDWETCMTMNSHWGYYSYDTNFKSTEMLLRNLIDIASKGGNYLVNIGPDGNGIVPQPEVERLQEIGKWLKVNGEAIYGTSATIFDVPTGAFSTTGEKDPKSGKLKFFPTWNWRSTTKGNKVYVEIFDWKNSFHVDKMPRKVTSAYLLADPAHKPLKVTQSGDGLDVRLPDKALDTIATVLVLNTVS